MEGLDKGTGGSIRPGYRHLLEACPVVSKSLSSFVADLLSLKMRCQEAVSRASLLEVRFCALESALSSNNTINGDLEI